MLSQTPYTTPPGVPVTDMDLAGDLAESFARQATAGFILPAVLVMVVGAVLIAVSLLSGPLSEAARRIMSGSDGNRRNG